MNRFITQLYFSVWSLCSHYLLRADTETASRLHQWACDQRGCWFWRLGWQNPCGDSQRSCTVSSSRQQLFWRCECGALPVKSMHACLAGFPGPAKGLKSWRWCITQVRADAGCSELCCLIHVASSLHRRNIASSWHMWQDRSPRAPAVQWVRVCFNILWHCGGEFSKTKRKKERSLMLFGSSAVGWLSCLNTCVSLAGSIRSSHHECIFLSPPT